MRTLTEQGSPSRMTAGSLAGGSGHLPCSVSALIAVLVALVLAAPAVAAPRPETPSGKPGRIVRHAYWYRTVWTASDGTKIYASCRVARVTRCWITRIG
jgi:hypothetical protein